jgi:hypothetical protein
MNATAIQPLPEARPDPAGKVALVVGSGRDSTATAAALASAGAAVTLAAADEPASSERLGRFGALADGRWPSPPISARRGRSAAWWRRPWGPSAGSTSP